MFLLFRKYGLQIKDFGKSWKDGVAFNAMIHNIRPDLVDMDKIRRQQARINLEHAFSTAENQLGIARLLDPEGQCHPHCVHACVFSRLMFVCLRWTLVKNTLWLEGTSNKQAATSQPAENPVLCIFSSWWAQFF